LFLDKGLKMDEFLKAMHFRHACKLFDDTKKISKEDLDYILECGRMSPSSFGMEHWQFLVVQSQDLKEKLKPVCWNQSQITSCSSLIVITIKKQDVTDENYIQKMFERRGLDKVSTQTYIQKYNEFLGNQNIPQWCMKQCYIAMANMMNAAAFKQIDSCPIEGFEKEEVEKILNLDTSKQEVAVIVSFGFRKNQQGKHYRLENEEIIKYL
jgi:nitroreductase